MDKHALLQNVLGGKTSFAQNFQSHPSYVCILALTNLTNLTKSSHNQHQILPQICNRLRVSEVYSNSTFEKLDSAAVRCSAESDFSAQPSLFVRQKQCRVLFTFDLQYSTSFLLDIRRDLQRKNVSIYKLYRRTAQSRLT